MKKAKLIICHHSDDFRALKEMEGSGSQYISGSRETSKSVTVVEASVDTIKDELKKMGIEVISGFDKVAVKFHHELCSMKDGVLAWDEDTHQGFFEILQPSSTDK